ncbi:MAG: glycosyltransferase family 2 protein [Candidatus Woesearchaeota archaeon]
MNKLSAFIITKNEENKIENTLRNIRKLVDEIVIIDGYSNDRTCEIAKKYGARIIKSRFRGFDKEKNKGIRACKNEWILDIDADEILYPETIEEIKKTLENPKYNAYYISREEFFLGKKVMEIKLVRLYKKGCVHYEGYVHEVLKVNGKIGRLKGKIRHDNNRYRNLYDHFIYMNKLMEQEVKKLELSKVKISKAKNIWLIISKPILHFFGFLFYKGTIRAGWEGIWEAYLAAHYQFMIYLRYYEKHNLERK